jgi:hypothetical protein
MQQRPSLSIACIACIACFKEKSHCLVGLLKSCCRRDLGVPGGLLSDSSLLPPFTPVVPGGLLSDSSYIQVQ